LGAASVYPTNSVGQAHPLSRAWIACASTTSPEWRLDGIETKRAQPILTERKILVGGTESFAGFFGIPEDRPRRLFIANAGIFTSAAEVDRLADAIDAIGRLPR
jgi:hypothetical protein